MVIDSTKELLVLRKDVGDEIRYHLKREELSVAHLRAIVLRGINEDGEVVSEWEGRRGKYYRVRTILEEERTGNSIECYLTFHSPESMDGERHQAKHSDHFVVYLTLFSLKDS